MRGRGVAWATVLFAEVALGAISEHLLRVGGEDDVFAMEERGELLADDAEHLVELLQRPVDLGTASRAELAELPGVDGADVERLLEHRRTEHQNTSGALATAALVDAGVLTEAQLDALAPFIRATPLVGAVPSLAGEVRLVTRTMPTDALAPPVLLGARLGGPFGLEANLWLATTRQALASPTWETSAGAGGALVTGGAPYQVTVPVAGLQWRWGQLKVVAGTFAVGFGERLVLDTTRRANPDGLELVAGFPRISTSSRRCRSSPSCADASDSANTNNSGAGSGSGSDDAASSRFVTSDFAFREPFRGLAASLEAIPVGADMTLSLAAFASYQTRSASQYELYDARACADPRRDALVQCDAPPVYLSDLSTRVSSSTLPRLFDELALGAHLGLTGGERWKFGLTGYRAAPTFHAAPAELDFQEWSRWPNGGPFGAVGVDGSLHLGDVGLFVEVARSFDGSVGNQGGGWGVVQRTTWGGQGHQLELSARYFDAHFVNPHARPISAPDEYDGQRARNEAGARLRYSARLGAAWRVGARADLWLNPFEVPGLERALVPHLHALARLDFTGWAAAQPSLWVETRLGELTRATLRLELAPLERRLRLTAQGSLSRTTDGAATRYGLLAWLALDARPLDMLELQARARYLLADLAGPEELEQSARVSLEVALSPISAVRLAARYELFVLLDARPSTLTRWPNPEHRLGLDVRFTF